MKKVLLILYTLLLCFMGILVHAEDQIYKVHAIMPWNRTGVYSDPSAPNSSIVITVVGGSWTANPAWGFMVDGNGNTQYTANINYALPGVAEGALVGKLGEKGKPFYIGNKSRIPYQPHRKELFLTCNDERIGYRDNRGVLQVTIVTQVNQVKKEEK